MELGSIVQYLENRSIMVTGATGFLAKIFVEKIIRAQPNVKKLFLLVRSSDASSATRRLHDEVMGKELFKVVREKLGAKLSLFLSEKVIAVPGDISCENLGVMDSNLREEMLKEVDTVVNLAATTNFHERYDVAMRINTWGAMHVLNFAKQCPRMEMFLHVSTAYVCGVRGGLIPERAFQMSETLNGTLGLDINAENKLADDTLQELRSEGADEEAITLAMKDLGTARARHHGWPNTYVFTKAMGEMLLGHSENIPLIILRPTIITSTFKEPFPGWVEGFRTIDSITAAYCKGKLKHFLCSPTTIADLIPADMVANSMIVAMAVAHANGSADGIIYQVGSSARNPITYTDFQDYVQHYFNKYPWIDKDGKSIKVKKLKLFNMVASFHTYITIRYWLLLKALQLLNVLSFQYLKGRYEKHDRMFKLLMLLVDTYKPYLFFKGIFDDMNTEKLRVVARGIAVDADAFCFDPTCIEWEDYFVNIHLPGVAKYVFK